MNDPRISSIFTIRTTTRTRYGASALGNSLILARNLFQADAGTRFVLVQPRRLGPPRRHLQGEDAQHPVLIRELDRALGNVITDWTATPSRTRSGRTSSTRRWSSR
jgi:hypothetical protein